VALRRDEQYEGFDWQRAAACRGEHTTNFFPPTHFERKDVRLARERVAKAICRTCPVAAECLEYAISSREPHGVWGGLNEVERRQLIERRTMSGGVEPTATDSPAPAPAAVEHAPDGSTRERAAGASRGRGR
jgi:WhiB family transcriptional regulator, redox-sensing transcriptional regulator